MDSLPDGNVVSKEISNEYRQELRNKIIAVGLNSLANAYGKPDEELLNEYISSSINDILPTWPLLQDKVRFQIFVKHIDSFIDYMKKRADGEGE